MGTNGVEGEALSSPKETSASLSTWKAEKPTARPRLKAAANWIAEHELWLLAVPVCLLVFLSQLPLVVLGAGLLLIPIPWLCRKVAKGYLTVRTSLDVPIIVLLAMALIALYPSFDLSLSLPVLCKMIIEAALFYGIVNNAGSKKGIHLIAGILLMAGVSASLLGLVNTQFTRKLFSLPQIYGRLPKLLPFLNKAGFNRNIVGGTLAMIFPINLSLFLFRPKWIPQPVLALSSLVIGSVLLLAQSRGALLGLAIALLIMAIWRSRWFLLVIPLILVGGFLAIGHFGVESVANTVLIMEATGSSQGRFELWQRAIYMMQDFPFTGIGLGTFSRVAPVMYPFFLAGPKAVIPHAHNLYLQMGVDLGLPGFVAFIALITAFSLTALQTIRLAKGSELEPLAVGLFCGFIVYLVHGLLDNITFSTKPGTVIWGIMGLTVALWLKLRE